MIGFNATGRFDRPKAVRTDAVRAQVRVVGQDRTLQVAQRRTGLETELGGEQQSNTAVGGEGVGGSSRLVEGEHQLTPRPLAVGMRLNERFQLTDASLTGAAGELGLERLLDDGRVELVQSLHLPRRQGSLGHVGVRLAAERRIDSRSTSTTSLARPSAIAWRASASSCGDQPSVDLDLPPDSRR